MSRAKHKGYRTVIDVTRFEYNGRKVTQVTWCIVERRTTRAVYSEHIGVSTYVNSVRHQGIGAYLSRKAVAVNKIDLKRVKQESFTQAYYNSLRGVNRSGTIHWFDKLSGTGYIRDDATKELFVLYACNAVGADSHYPELTTNVNFEKGDAVLFTLLDYHTTRNCGATRVEKVPA